MPELVTKEFREWLERELQGDNLPVIIGWIRSRQEGALVKALAPGNTDFDKGATAAFTAILNDIENIKPSTVEDTETPR